MKADIRFSPLNFLVLSLLLFVHQSTVSAQSCPQGCYCMGNLVDCISPTFPMQLPSGMIEGVVIRGNLSTIPANAFIQPQGGVLKSLSIGANVISNIKAYAFSNLIVNSVSLYNVQIKHLEPRVFSNLTCDVLSMFNLAIEIMPTYLFEGLTTGTLYIYNNNITTLEPYVFKSATFRSAAFYHNKIYTIQKNAFSSSFPMKIYLNKIKTFLKQDSLVLISFHSNTFRCACSLTWMWEDDSPLKSYLSRNSCLGAKQDVVNLKNVNKSSLCSEVDMSHTSGSWEHITTKSNTMKPESSRPTLKGTTSQENSTKKPGAPPSTDRMSGTGKLATNMLMMIVIVSVVTCSLILF